MPKFTANERSQIQSIVATLSIKRIPDAEIVKEIYEQTHKTVSRQTLFNIRKRIKKDSYKWYQKLREGEYEYIHEFKERINEINDLQKRHHKIIEDNPHGPTIQQASLVELHKLNITLSNYFDVAPTILNFNIGNKSNTNTNKENSNGDPLSISQQDKEGIIV